MLEEGQWSLQTKKKQRTGHVYNVMPTKRNTIEGKVMQGDSISLIKEIRIYQTVCPMGSFTVPLHAAALCAPQGKLRIIIN